MTVKELQEYRRRAAAYARENGFCTICGVKLPAEYKYRRCRLCRLKRREYEKRKKAENELL